MDRAVAAARETFDHGSWPTLSLVEVGVGPQSGLPFGGFKQSGIGREGSPEAFDLYTEVKTTYLMN